MVYHTTVEVLCDCWDRHSLPVLYEEYWSMEQTLPYCTRVNVCIGVSDIYRATRPSPKRHCELKQLVLYLVLHWV